MENSVTHVLLIDFSANNYKLIQQILTETGYSIDVVTTLESTIHKLMAESPDLIICYHQLGNYTGFQLYNRIEKEILNMGVPFILVLDEFSITEITMGQELGIDAFLFPPFEPETIVNILDNKIRKSQMHRSLSFKYLKQIYELIPIGIFIADNHHIIQANSHFSKILGENELDKGLTIEDLFDFSRQRTDDIKLKRFLNGITKSCNFNELPLKTSQNIVVKLKMCYLENGMREIRVFGSVILLTSDDRPIERREAEPFFNDYHNGLKPKFEIKFLTNREQEILNLSGEGLPIKIIADQLGISERTVEKHRSNILHKTNAGNIIEALAYVRKQIQILND